MDAQQKEDSRKTWRDNAEPLDTAITEAISELERLRTDLRNISKKASLFSTEITKITKTIEIIETTDKTETTEITEITVLDMGNSPYLVDPIETQVFLQDQSATHFAINPTQVGLNPILRIGELHPAEVAALNQALELLNSQERPHAVALDILERDDEGKINSPIASHTVVLRRLNKIFTLIDPNQESFSRNLFKYMQANKESLPGLLDKELERPTIVGSSIYGPGEKKTHWVTNPGIQQSDQLAGNARDCIDIALKLIYEIERHPEQDIQDIVKILTNQRKAYLTEGQKPRDINNQNIDAVLSFPSAQNSRADIRAEEARYRAFIFKAATAQQVANTTGPSSSSSAFQATPSGTIHPH